MLEASTGAGPPKLDDEMLKALETREMPHLDRVPMPFSVVIGPRSSIGFRTPVANHRHKPVGVGGQIFRPDDTPLQRDQKRQAAIQTTWTNLRFQVTPQEAGEREIAGAASSMAPRRVGSATRTNRKSSCIGCSDADRTQRQTLGSTYMLIQGLRLEYRW